MSLPTLATPPTTADSPTPPGGRPRRPRRVVAWAAAATAVIAVAAGLHVRTGSPADPTPGRDAPVPADATLPDAVAAARWRAVALDLGARLASLDAIERAVALRDWQAATGVPARWIAAGTGPAAGAGPGIAAWGLDDRRVVVSVPRPPDGPAGIDGLVLGPWPVRPAGDATTTPASDPAPGSAWPPGTVALLAAVAGAFAAGWVLATGRRPRRPVTAATYRPGEDSTPGTSALAVAALPRPAGPAGGAASAVRPGGDPDGDDLVVLLRREVDRVRRLHADAAGDAGGTIGAAGLQVDFDPWVEQPVAHQPALVRRAVRGLLAQAADRARRVVVVAVRIEAGEVLVEVDDDGPAPTVDRPSSFAAPDEPACVFADTVAEAHGGRFELASSPLGGLRRTMRWPAGPATGVDAREAGRPAARRLAPRLPPDVPYDRRDPRGTRGRRADDPHDPPAAR